jgi:uncharacterized protein YndB with AHSA1/START domain
METNNDAILVEAIIHASPKQVWKAWTDPNLLKYWFGSDPNGKVLEAKIDPRPGGNFEVTFCDSDGTEHTCSGVYKDVLEFNRLTFSWRWKSEPGVESFIILSLFPDGHSTRMQLEHLNPGSGSKHDYIKGWQSTFTKLEKLMRIPF